MAAAHALGLVDPWRGLSPARQNYRGVSGCLFSLTSAAQLPWFLTAILEDLQGAGDVSCLTDAINVRRFS